MGKKKSRFDSYGQRNGYRPDQPRDIIGRWRLDLDPSDKPYYVTNKDGSVWHDRYGKARTYFVNNRDRLAAASTTLNMAASPAYANQLTKLDARKASGHEYLRGQDQDTPATPYERIHVMSNTDGEEMAIAASPEGTFGLINHDRQGPADQFSMSRGSEYQPLSKNLKPDETGWGGRAAQLTDRADGKRFSTLDATRAEEINWKALEGPDAHPHTATPEQFRLGALRMRHWYQSQGMTESQARRQPIWVHASNDGKLKFEPAMMPDPDNPGKWTRRHGPKSAAGGSSAQIRGDQLTRMAGAMARDGVERVDYAISGGTNLSKKGRPLNNALHFRADYTQKTSRENVTMWGTIETAQRGVVPKPARNELLGKDGKPDPEKVAERRKEQTAFLRRRAKPFHNPTDPEGAATLMRRRWHEDVDEDRIVMGRKGYFAVKPEPGDDIAWTYRPDGERAVARGVTVKGFKQVVNARARAANAHMPLDLQSVRRRGDGRFEARDSRDGVTRVWEPTGSPSSLEPEGAATA